MAFSIVQDSGPLNTGTASLPFTWAVPPTVSSARKIVVFVTAYGPPGSITVSDNATPPNTYTQRVSNATGDSYVAIFDADIANAPTTTTITLGTASDTTANMIEIDGLAPPAFDSNGNAVLGGGSAPHSLTPAGTLAQAANVQFACIGGNGGAGPIMITPPTGFTLIQAEYTNAYIQHASAYRVIATTTPGASIWTTSVSLSADMLVAYKLAAGGGAAALAGAAAAVVVATGALSTQIRLAATPTAVATATAALTTQKRLNAAAAAVATATGSLTTQKRLNAAAQAVATATGALTGGSSGAALVANAAAVTAATGSLTTSIRLAAAAAAIATATGSLTGGSAPATSKLGSEIVGGQRPRRRPNPNFRPWLQRVLDARSQRVKPAKERAAKRAKAIEQEAAKLIVDDPMARARFEALMARWMDERPVIPPGLDLSELFAAQVGFRLRQMALEEAARAALQQARERDEEDALTVLLLT